MENFKSHHQVFLRHVRIPESHPLRDISGPTCWNPQSKKGRLVSKTCSLLKSAALQPSTDPGQCSITFQSVEKQSCLDELSEKKNLSTIKL